LISFNLAKSRFAEALEHFGDGKSGGFLDALIQIDETPRELAREKRADGGLAGSHESGETNNLSAGGRAAQRKRLSHCSV